MFTKALPPVLPNVSQVGSGSAAAMALSQSHLTPAVMYAAGDGHIHEIVLKGTWQDRDLTAAAGAPVTYSGLTQPMAYRRSDGVSMVVYRGTDDHIHSLYLELLRQGNNWQEVWHWADLSAITGSPAAASDPYGYVRSDGINAIVYATSGADAGRIYELRLDNGWQYYELTSVPSAVRGYRPVGYVRADGISAVVYVGGSVWHVQEIWLGTAWQWADLSYLAGAPAMDSYPWPYNRSVVARVCLPQVVRQR